jgi:hypothetical protein
MRTRLLAHFRDFLPALTLLPGSFVWHVCTSFSTSPLLATPPDFHVQLSHRALTSDWESFFSYTYLVLIPKSNLRALLRTA